ncbi:hypothetical protein FBEOM_13066 [Fusarium beomiforme]|uniref:Uncharacterized protein n=1 Tax=Fusarium beomiforme TaxID=44412 RepID=A0A9P5DSS8_9HYPO|nr:hypothetical protein FBEOM_13066 [Fusarium beomiforme]
METYTKVETITNNVTEYNTTVFTITPTKTIKKPKKFTPVGSEAGSVAPKVRLAKRAPCRPCKSKVHYPYMTQPALRESSPQMLSLDKRFAEKSPHNSYEKLLHHYKRNSTHENNNTASNEYGIKVGSKNGTKLLIEPSVYPQKVECVQYVKITHQKHYTIKGCNWRFRKTRVKTLGPTTAIEETTSTMVIAATVTKADFTVTADKIVTMTITSTSVVEQIRNVTDFETQTATAPAVTFYAACAPDNIVNSANGGKGIQEVIYGSGQNHLISLPPYEATSTESSSRSLVLDNKGGPKMTVNHVLGSDKVRLTFALAPGSPETPELGDKTNGTIDMTDNLRSLIVIYFD